MASLVKFHNKEPGPQPGTHSNRSTSVAGFEGFGSAHCGSAATQYTLDMLEPQWGQGVQKVLLK